MSDISKLAPAALRSHARKQASAISAIVNEIVGHAAILHAGSDLLTEVYLAGLWHGAEMHRLGLADDSRRKR